MVCAKKRGRTKRLEIEPKSGFEKNFFKLMNNLVSGKTIENLRNRITVNLVRGDEVEKIRKQIASPLYAHHTVFNDNLAAIRMHKQKIKLVKPFYSGMCVLNLSKTLMYEFYYNRLKVRYGSRWELLYMDTDSPLLEVEMPDVYRDMQEDLDEYDTSDYPREYYQYSAENKKVVDKMKDECAGTPIREVVYLRSKMYSVLMGSKNIKKAKGTTKVVTKKELRHQSYLEALFERKTFWYGVEMLCSNLHTIYGMHVNKVTLSPFDNKRWICDGRVHTLAYGHKDIR